MLGMANLTLYPTTGPIHTPQPCKHRQCRHKSQATRPSWLQSRAQALIAPTTIQPHWKRKHKPAQIQNQQTHQSATRRTLRPARTGTQRRCCYCCCCYRQQSSAASRRRTARSPPWRTLRRRRPWRGCARRRKGVSGGRAVAAKSRLEVAMRAMEVVAERDALQNVSPGPCG